MLKLNLAKRWLACVLAALTHVFGARHARKYGLRLVIAIAGGIASGKSTVGRDLEAAGVLVIDTDAISHELTDKPGPAYDAVLRRFGQEFATIPGGPIDRKRLGKRVFNDKVALADLEAIMHPAILDLMRQRILQSSDGSVVAVQVPLLFEKRLQHLFDECWCIVVSRARQIQFLTAREGISVQEAETRINTQWSAETKAALADRVIDNNGTLAQTRAQALRCLAAAKKCAGLN